MRSDGHHHIDAIKIRNCFGSVDDTLISDSFLRAITVEMQSKSGEKGLKQQKWLFANETIAINLPRD